MRKPWKSLSANDIKMKAYFAVARLKDPSPYEISNAVCKLLNNRLHREIGIQKKAVLTGVALAMWGGNDFTGVFKFTLEEVKKAHWNAKLTEPYTIGYEIRMKEEFFRKHRK